MKIVDVDDEDWNKVLKISDLENFFDVVTDKRNNYVFNLNTTIYFNVDKTQLSKFTCTHDMHWPLISYKIYGTTRLAWLLWKLNDISAKNIFDIIEAKTEIYYLPEQSVETILADINNFDE